MFANQIGCDGERVYYDGGASVACNGKIVAQGCQFSIHEVVWESSQTSKEIPENLGKSIKILGNPQKLWGNPYKIWGMHTKSGEIHKTSGEIH